MSKALFRSLGAVCLIVSLVLIIIALVAVYVYAASGAVGEDKELNIDLIPPEVYQYTSIYSLFKYEYAQKYNTATEGTFSVESSQSRYKNTMMGALTTTHLDYLDLDEIYELWIMDIDSGYQLSLGLFMVDQDGDERFTWSQPAYINEYDMVFVTKEPYEDDNPWPSGEVVLVGYFDTESLTKSSYTSSNPSLGEYADYGEEADTVYG